MRVAGIEWIEIWRLAVWEEGETQRRAAAGTSL